MNQLEARECPICGRRLTEPPSSRGRIADVAYYSCPHCGQYGLTRQAAVGLVRLDLSHDSQGRRAPAFAYAVRRMQMGQQEWPLVDRETAERIIDSAVLPSVKEQADNLIRWLGDNLFSPGETESVSDET